MARCRARLENMYYDVNELYVGIHVLQGESTHIHDSYGTADTALFDGCTMLHRLFMTWADVIFHGYQRAGQSLR